MGSASALDFSYIRLLDLSLLFLCPDWTDRLARRGLSKGCLVQWSGWTRDVDRFLQWLSAIPLAGGGFSDAAIAEGLSEALMSQPWTKMQKTMKGRGSDGPSQPTLAADQTNDDTLEDLM